MDFILYEVDGAVATITINRPKALNALNSQVLDELNATLDAVDLDTVRCLILTGAGDKSFVAGADIGEMSTLTKAEGEAFGKKGNDVFRKIETLEMALERIKELEAENQKLNEELEYYRNRKVSGRQKHNDKWQSIYNDFVVLYESGMSIAEIAKEKKLSERTIYRYKAYYDKVMSEQKALAE